jgi:glycosidase
MKPLATTILPLLLLLHVSCATPEAPRPWNEDIIYFMMTDRFLDGDSENNQPADSAPYLYDATQSNIDLYHGGDFRGIEKALAADYFNELGITAIWITPPVSNIWYSSYDLHDAPKTGYHGYWTQDFLDIDPHLVSSTAFDSGTAYADTRDGRMQHYKDLVALAHRKGIKVVQDIVCNHAGPVFYYDTNSNGSFDSDEKSEWIRPFKENGFHNDAVWAYTPEWNQDRTEPTQSLTILGTKIHQYGSLGRLESYGRKGMSSGSLGASNGEEMTCDFFSLRDFWTQPDSSHFDQLVDDFVAIYQFYIEDIGVDGLRIDTVKHVHHAFWDEFTERLRERLGPERAKKVILFGEVYDGNPEALGKYTYRADWPQETAPSIDSLLNFQFCYAVRSYLRTGNDSVGTAQGIDDATRTRSANIPEGKNRPYFNQEPGLDGLNASDKLINFVENHDGINRFRVKGVSAERNFLANALTLLMPGIPCLYYGTEIALQDEVATVHEDAETGRLTYFPAGTTDPFKRAKENEHFQRLAAFIALRNTLPALTGSTVNTLWIDNDSSTSDDGIFAFARGTDTDEPIIAVINASSQTAHTATNGHSMPLVDGDGNPLLQAGDQLVPIVELPTSNTPTTLTWEGGIAHARIQVNPESVQLFRIVKN